MLVTFLNCKFTPVFTLTVKEVTTNSPQLRNEKEQKEQCTFLRIRSYINYLELFDREICLFSIYVLIQLFIYISIDSQTLILHFGL